MEDQLRSKSHVCTVNESERRTTYLSLCELVQVLQWLRLRKMLECRQYGSVSGTHVLQDGLHQCNSDLSLLDKVVLSILDFNASSFLLRRAGILQST